MKLTKASALAEKWEITEDELKRRARRYGWPCVRLSRTDIRFTEQQIEQIVAMQSRAAKTKAPKDKQAGTGQSKRSASRST